MVKASKASSKVCQHKFVIDCVQPVEDSVIVASDFKDFLLKRIKNENKLGNLQDKVNKLIQIVLTNDSSKITVTASIAFSKRYLKYLTKKYLKKQELRDYLHVVALDKNTYKLKYFNIQQDEEEEQ